MFSRLTAPTTVTVVVVLTEANLDGSLEIAVTLTRNVPAEVFVTLRLNILLCPGFSDTVEVMLIAAVEAVPGLLIARVYVSASLPLLLRFRT